MKLELVLMDYELQVKKKVNLKLGVDGVWGRRNKHMLMVVMVTSRGRCLTT